MLVEVETGKVVKVVRVESARREEVRRKRRRL
jgi:hypothetical protein